MLYCIIKKNTYQDSVNLMLLSKKLSNLENVNNVSVMMGTDANKDIFFNSGLYTQELDSANANDLCLVVDTENKEMLEVVVEEMKEFFENTKKSGTKQGLNIVHSFSTVKNKMPDANIALISIPGEYAYKESMKALKQGMNVFLFSDNVSIIEEKNLKEYANNNGLIVMGPDCGTSLINSIPFAFSNEVEKGNIGIIGASGTGIQEIMTNISNLGGGISHAIGLGGRDLKGEIGAISTFKALELLEKDENTKIIVFVSKPPAKEILDLVIKRFEISNKPIIANFLGSNNLKSEKVVFTKTLYQTAKKAYQYSKEYKKINKKINKVLGLYCGGTLAQETAILLKDKLENKNLEHKEGIMFENENIKIIDLGDDFYTKGKPHPMIDPSIRIEVLEKEINKYDLFLLDNVIGYGSNLKMAEYTKEIANKYKEKLFICSITGTENDIQKYSREKELLNEPNIIVLNNNEEIAEFVIDVLKFSKLDIKALKEDVWINKNLKIVNIGLRKFIEPLISKKVEVLQFDFKPIAGGNKELEKMLEDLE